MPALADIARMPDIEALQRLADATRRPRAARVPGEPGRNRWPIPPDPDWKPAPNWRDQERAYYNFRELSRMIAERPIPLNARRPWSRGSGRVRAPITSERVHTRSPERDTTKQSW